MNNIKGALPVCAGMLALLLAGCASTLQNMVKSPSVALRGVELVSLGLSNQTFMLTFDVNNPNSFSLPVSSVTYGVKLDGQRFASGTTADRFSIPASGASQFAISVDLNLLQTAPQLLSLARQGLGKEVKYELEGQLAVDLPLAPPLTYRNSGSIRMDSGAT